MADIKFPEEIKIPEVKDFPTSPSKSMADDILATLNEDEKAAVFSILKELSQKGSSETFEDLKYADFAEIPVGIEEFLDNDDYLGKGI
jgi:hypothetical protein